MDLPGAAKGAARLAHPFSTLSQLRSQAASILRGCCWIFDIKESVRQIKVDFETDEKLAFPQESITALVQGGRKRNRYKPRDAAHRDSDSWD